MRGMGEERLEGMVRQLRDNGRDGMVGEYRRWEERVGKGVGEGRLMQWGREGELRREEGRVR